MEVVRSRKRVGKGNGRGRQQRDNHRVGDGRRSVEMADRRSVGATDRQQCRIGRPP